MDFGREKPEHANSPNKKMVAVQAPEADSTTLHMKNNKIESYTVTECCQ